MPRRRSRLAKRKRQALADYLAAGGDPEKWDQFRLQPRGQVWLEDGGALPPDVLLPDRRKLYDA